MEYEQQYGEALKRLMETVLGRNSWAKLKHCQCLKTWKHYCARLLKAHKVTIAASVRVVDAEWMNEVNFEIEHGLKTIESARDFTSLFMNMTACLSTLSFLQAGDIPDFQTDNNVVRDGPKWRMDSLRSVQYIQNKEQKYLAEYCAKRRSNRCEPKEKD